MPLLWQAMRAIFCCTYHLWSVPAAIWRGKPSARQKHQSMLHRRPSLFPGRNRRRKIHRKRGAPPQIVANQNVRQSSSPLFQDCLSLPLFFWPPRGCMVHIASRAGSPATLMSTPALLCTAWPFSAAAFGRARWSSVKALCQFMSSPAHIWPPASLSHCIYLSFQSSNSPCFCLKSF